MATIVNTPSTTSDNSGSGFLLGVILLIVAAVLFIVYGIPFVTQSMTNTSPQVNVPGKIDVNVHNQGK